MTGWREHYERRDWDAVDDWWRGFDDIVGAAALLQQLRTDVPRLVRRNGMEEQDDYARPNEAPAEWRGAAEILHSGELAAWVEGEPEPVPDEWLHERSRVEVLLREFMEADEVTAGDSGLSRTSHAKEALDSLASIDWCTAMISNEIDPAGSKHEDREWLRAFAGEIAFLAFNAGAHARAAIGKAVESHAVRGKKVLDAAARSGQQRKALQRKTLDAILAYMMASIDEGHTVSAAAHHAFNAGLGASPEANRKRWNRHHKK